MENTSKVVHDEGTVGQTLLDGHSTPATGALAILSMSTPLPLPLPLPLPTRSENAQMSNSGQSQQDLLSCSANDNPRAFVLPGKHLPSSMLATGADSSGALRVHQRTPSDPGRISAATSMSTASTISNTADYHISTLPALSPEHIAAIRSSFISSGVVHGCDPADDQQDVIHVVATDGRNAISRHNADQNPPRVAPQVASRVALTVPEPSIPKLKLSTTSMVSLRSLHIVEPVEAVGPLPPPAGLFKRLANPFNAWRQHVFSEPQHWFWSLYDIVVRIVDFFHFMAFPAQVAYICDVGTTFIPLYIVCDIILWLSLFLGVRRPQRDRFGQLVVGAEAKRLFYTAKLSTRFEVLSLLPLDWIVYVVATWNKAPELTCTNPTYVYGDGLPQSRVPIPGRELLDIRHNYTGDDIPWLLQLYVYSRLLRAMHLYRSLKWGIDLRIPKLVDPISRLVKTLTFTVVFSHVDSCLFWIMSTYLPSNDRWINNARILTESNGEIRSLGESFTRNLYHAERALFFVPRDTGNFAEIVYQIIEMLYAAVLYGSIFGNMSSIVRSLDNSAGLDKAAKQRKFKKLSLEQYMKEYKFPPDLQTKVLQQEEFDWAHKKGVNTDDLFKFLPQSIREQVNYHLYHNLIASVPIFKDHADEVIKRALCQKISIINITSNFYICKAGERGTEMYFLREGEIEILNPSEEKILVTLGPGSFFGEVALFSNTLRTATARTKTEVQLCVLQKKEFDEILAQYSGLVDVFTAQIEARYAADRARAAVVALELHKSSRDPRRASQASSLASIGKAASSLLNSTFNHLKLSTKRLNVSAVGVSESASNSRLIINDPGLGLSPDTASIGGGNGSSSISTSKQDMLLRAPIRATSVLTPIEGDKMDSVQANVFTTPRTEHASTVLERTEEEP